MSRKYRMQGYQGGDDDRPKTRKTPGEAPTRGRVETSYRRTIRCTECSAAVQFLDELKTSDTCQKCGCDLHTCRNCKFFDPGAPNECIRPVEKRVEGKNTRNSCPLFSPKVLVEKAVEKRTPSVEKNARQAFEDLFEK